jgi:fructose-specific component phosphotransferase system IIB-like protein
VGAVAKGEHVLVIDEINRADLARVLGEAVAQAGEDTAIIAKP